jgi:hypothetical protein
VTEIVIIAQVQVQLANLNRKLKRFLIISCERRVKSTATEILRNISLAKREHLEGLINE